MKEREWRAERERESKKKRAGTPDETFPWQSMCMETRDTPWERRMKLRSAFKKETRQDKLRRKRKMRDEEEHSFRQQDRERMWGAKGKSIWTSTNICLLFLLSLCRCFSLSLSLTEIVAYIDETRHWAWLYLQFARVNCANHTHTHTHKEKQLPLLQFTWHLRVKWRLSRHLNIVISERRRKRERK